MDKVQRYERPDCAPKFRPIFQSTVFISLLLFAPLFDCSVEAACASEAKPLLLLRDRVFHSKQGGRDQGESMYERMCDSVHEGFGKFHDLQELQHKML